MLIINFIREIVYAQFYKFKIETHQLYDNSNNHGYTCIVLRDVGLTGLIRRPIPEINDYLTVMMQMQGHILTVIIKNKQ